MNVNPPAGVVRFGPELACESVRLEARMYTRDVLFRTTDTLGELHRTAVLCKNFGSCV